ncbi:hypothetical protein PINS_up013994 [Pythium insidiosum]|nr:hypothetical protein PINS_up013994 [Pythium insidiosum]
MYELMAERTSSGAIDVSSLDEAEQNALKLRILAAFLLPLADHYVVLKKRQQLLPFVIIRDSLKLRTRDAEDVGNTILKNVTEFRELLTASLNEFDRVRVGLSLRSMGELWELTSDIALVQDIVDGAEMSREVAISRHTSFKEAVTSHGLMGVWNMKPLLNGNDLIKTLGVKPGPAVKETMDQVIVWQLQNPSASREECLSHFVALKTTA